MPMTEIRPMVASTVADLRRVSLRETSALRDGRVDVIVRRIVPGALREDPSAFQSSI
jgi:FXSXX-COOH protein